MGFKKFLKKKRRLWHRHFLPSLFAGIIVGLIAFLFEATIANIILLASIGASAIILTNSESHHLTKLMTIIYAYTISIIVSLIIYSVNLYFSFPVYLNIFLVVFIIGLALFLFDVFHPPVITASIAFIQLERPLIELFYLFAGIIVLLILIRLITYLLRQELSIKKFFREFKRNLREDLD